MCWTTLPNLWVSPTTHRFSPPHITRIYPSYALQRHTKLFIMTFLQENVSVDMKRVRAKVFIQDLFNPMLFKKDAERYVDVSNIVYALTCYNCHKDILDFEKDDLIIFLDVLHHANEGVRGSWDRWNDWSQWSTTRADLKDKKEAVPKRFFFTMNRKVKQANKYGEQW